RIAQVLHLVARRNADYSGGVARSIQVPHPANCPTQSSQGTGQRGVRACQTRPAVEIAGMTLIMIVTPGTFAPRVGRGCRRCRDGVWRRALMEAVPSLPTGGRELRASCGGATSGR